MWRDNTTITWLLLHKAGTLVHLWLLFATTALYSCLLMQVWLWCRSHGSTCCRLLRLLLLETEIVIRLLRSSDWVGIRLIWDILLHFLYRVIWTEWSCRVHSLRWLVHLASVWWLVAWLLCCLDCWKILLLGGRPRIALLSWSWGSWSLMATILLAWSMIRWYDGSNSTHSAMFNWRLHGFRVVSEMANWVWNMKSLLAFLHQAILASIIVTIVRRCRRLPLRFMLGTTLMTDTSFLILNLVLIDDIRRGSLHVSCTRLSWLLCGLYLIPSVWLLMLVHHSICSLLMALTSCSHLGQNWWSSLDLLQVKMVLLSASARGRRENWMRAVRNQLLLCQCSSVRLRAFTTRFACLWSAFGWWDDDACLVLCSRRTIILRLMMVEGARTEHNFAIILLVIDATGGDGCSVPGMLSMHRLRACHWVLLATTTWIWSLWVHQEAGSFFTTLWPNHLMVRVFLNHRCRTWWNSVSSESWHMLQYIGRALRVSRVIGLRVIPSMWLRLKL